VARLREENAALHAALQALALATLPEELHGELRGGERLPPACRWLLLLPLAAGCWASTLQRSPGVLARL
jgi:anti-sigma factor RsiW